MSQGGATDQFMLTTVLSISVKSMSDNSNYNRTHNDGDDDIALTTGSASNVY